LRFSAFKDSRVSIAIRTGQRFMGFSHSGFGVHFARAVRFAHVQKRKPLMASTNTVTESSPPSC
jgi:hypothetical protein